MQTRIDEIGDRIYRISTFIPDIAEPAGFTFNQFLLDAEEPLLFHTGMRQLCSSFRGDGGAALRALADGYEKRFAPEAEFAATRGALSG
jgi:hypothetical protein